MFFSYVDAKLQSTQPQNTPVKIPTFFETALIYFSLTEIGDAWVWNIIEKYIDTENYELKWSSNDLVKKNSDTHKDQNKTKLHYNINKQMETLIGKYKLYLLRNLLQLSTLLLTMQFPVWPEVPHNSPHTFSSIQCFERRKRLWKIFLWVNIPN